METAYIIRNGVIIGSGTNSSVNPDSSSTYIINCTIVSETGLETEVTNYDGNFTKIKQTIADGGKVELRTNFNSSNYILEPSRIEENYVTFNTIDKNANITIKVTEYGINDVSYIDLTSGGIGSGATPRIDPITKHWFIGETDTGILAEGTNGTDGTTYTPSIGEVTTVDSTELASATVSVNTETKEAVFNFAIPKGNKGLDGVQISDNETVENKTWSSKKTSDEIAKVDDKVIETITNPTELDTNKFNKNGHYSIGDATGRTNLPMQNVGTLLVYYAGHYVIQEYILNANLRRFMRRSTDKGANWSAWQELATMDKLGGLSFSASGTTLTITNGTNTWTLEANS